MTARDNETQPRTARPALPTGTVTFMFTDMESSTRILQGLGDQYRNVLAQHHQLVREALAAHEGIEVGTEGDPYFAVFALATGPVAAAVDIQRALARHSWPDGVEVPVAASTPLSARTSFDHKLHELGVEPAAGIAVQLLERLLVCAGRVVRPVMGHRVERVGDPTSSRRGRLPFTVHFEARPAGKLL